MLLHCLNTNVYQSAELTSNVFHFNSQNFMLIIQRSKKPVSAVQQSDGIHFVCYFQERKCQVEYGVFYLCYSIWLPDKIFALATACSRGKIQNLLLQHVLALSSVCSTYTCI